MNGIVFFKTANLELMRGFYSQVLELPLWLDQGKCAIYQNGNMLFGFCQADKAETEGTITFFVPKHSDVDALYASLQSIAVEAPKANPHFSIYHFWAKDPEGRNLEFQAFEHPIEPHISLGEGLITRRSIRQYTSQAVPEEMLNKVFELCRYAPTACNMQSYYYVVIKQRDVLEKIVNLRGPAGEPILASPYAIAVVSRGELSRRKVQDACIAAYHLLLAAKAYGLGTCWVTDMDKNEVKDLLGVSHEDYIACITPIGFPAEDFPKPKRHGVSSFVRYV
ncbi:MAG: nitroreductase family protein [Candidatus Cloacimonetes bacterium]|nr:nitroreductase family protein [Candidatus Cloacimonadota bacterium]